MSIANAKFILLRLQDDMKVAGNRPLRDRENAFVTHAELGHLTVLYTRNGTPFAVGPSGNEDRWPFSVRTYQWPFDAETRIYCLGAAK